MRLHFRSKPTILCVILVSGLVAAPLLAPAAASDEDVKPQPAEKSAAEDKAGVKTAPTEERTEETGTSSEPVTDPSFNTLEDIYGSPVTVALLKGQRTSDGPRQSPQVLWRETHGSAVLPSSRVTERRAYPSQD